MQSTVSVDGMHYNVYGSGTAVVLLHGFAEDSAVWDAQVQDLKDHCRLIVPDLPGSGKSAVKGGERTIEDFADNIFSMLQQEQAKQCIILGHSMGGYIALAFAEKYPSLVKAFGLLHSTAFADSDEKKQNRLRGMEMMRTYGGYHFIKTTTPNLFSAAFKAAQTEKVAALIEAGKAFTVDALQQYYGAMMHRPDRTRVLANAKVPVLFIMGVEDVAAPVNDVLQQVHLPEIAYIHILENVGHMGMWEDEKQFNAAVLRFIREAGNELYS